MKISILTLNVSGTISQIFYERKFTLWILINDKKSFWRITRAAYVSNNGATIQWLAVVIEKKINISVNIYNVQRARCVKSEGRVPVITEFT